MSFIEFPWFRTKMLSNGIEMPVLGLGTWRSKGNELKNAIRCAVANGYRLIDTASIYGNEIIIGQVLRELMENGYVSREELFITTSAWATEIAPGKLEESLQESLRKLQLDYVDLYIAHLPTAIDQTFSNPIRMPVEDIWRQFDAVYRAGLTRSVGVANWSMQQIGRVMALGLTPIHNVQVEFHLFFIQHELNRYCLKRNIVVTGFAPLGSPDRLKKKGKYVRQLNYAANLPTPLKDPRVLELAEKYDKTPAQVLIRFLLDQRIIVIPKSTNPKHIVENCKVFDFKFSMDEIFMLEQDRKPERLFPHPFMVGHPEDPFASERKKK